MSSFSYKNKLKTTKRIRLHLMASYMEAERYNKKRYCPYCQCQLLPHEAKDAAHIKAASNFGEAKSGNIVLAHRRCNVGTETIKLIPPLSKYILY